MSDEPTNPPLDSIISAAAEGFAEVVAILRDDVLAGCDARGLPRALAYLDGYRNACDDVVAMLAKASATS